jgi:hypothetical protein
MSQTQALALVEMSRGDRVSLLLEHFGSREVRVSFALDDVEVVAAPATSQLRRHGRRSMIKTMIAHRKTARQQKAANRMRLCTKPSGS